MIMVKYLLPILALPLGEGIMPFVSADSFLGGAPQRLTIFIPVPIHFAGKVHDCCQNNEQSQASKQQSIIFQLQKGIEKSV